MTADEINGQWFVVRNDKPIAGPFQDNGQAWRWIDQHNEELLYWLAVPNLRAETMGCGLTVAGFKTTNRSLFRSHRSSTLRRTDL
jgi:hypothetical protein